MTKLSKAKYIYPYQNVFSVELDNGYIVWRLGTGENAELLHLRTYAPGKGTGRKLVKAMLSRLVLTPPYATVFGFTRTMNDASQAFYKALGFDLSEVKGVYADGTAVVFSQQFKTLLEIHNVQG